MRVLHAGPEGLAWDGACLVATGFGQQWRHQEGRWQRLERQQQPHEIGGNLGLQTDVCGDFVYATTLAGVRALGLRRQVQWLHPSGAAATGDEWATHAGAPGRSLWALQHALHPDSVRFSPEGGALFGIDADGHGRAVDLRAREETLLTGAPLASGVRVDQGRLWLRNEPSLPLAEASPAVQGTFVAGPGGCIWDLRSERPVSDAQTILLGATAPTANGFATIHWESHEGWTTTLDGNVVDRFRAELPDDDTAVALVDTPDGLVVVSAEGRSVYAHGGPASATHPAHELAAVPSPSGLIPRAICTRVGDRDYVATESGWLVSFPSSIS